jgi:hypothetical protein
MADIKGLGAARIGGPVVADNKAWDQAAKFFKPSNAQAPLSLGWKEERELNDLLDPSKSPAAERVNVDSDNVKRTLVTFKGESYVKQVGDTASFKAGWYKLGRTAMDYPTH